MKQDYKDFNALDFAQEDSFIHWIKDEDLKAASFWEKFITDHPEKEKQIQEASDLVKNLRFGVKPHSQEVESKIWEKIQKDISISAPKRTIGRRRLLWIIPAAAAVALLLLMILPLGTQTVVTRYTEHTVHTLPDQSIVHLNADSKISYNPKTWDTDREVKLEGEAFFEVKSGSLFTVSMGQNKVEVLGTSFNIYNREKISVKCFSGKVKVTSPNKKTIILTKGKAISDEQSEQESYDFDPEVQRYWRNGMATFKAEELMSVFSEIERQYGVNLIFRDEVGKRKFTGSFGFDDLNLALMDICKPMALSFSKTGNLSYEIISK